MLKPRAALSHWGVSGSPGPVPDPGLINETWLVGTPPCYVLQWVNPIFDPRIHLDIDAVTRVVAGAGLTTPRLVPTRDGALWIDDDERGFWRLMSYVPGRTIHRVDSLAVAAEAGAFAGRFHRALAEWGGTFEAPPRPMHDTPQRMKDLRAALEAADGHRLEGPARELGRSVLDAWERWDGELDQPVRQCHGDLKISNLRFARGRDEAVCLLDLDTLGTMPWSCEMGDAWRSWCNRAGEDDPETTRFDVEIFAASVRGWLAHAPPLEEIERCSLVPAIERICLELVARFCADAVQNSYFRENRERYPLAGDHNLLRARGQWALACSAREQRGACEAALGFPAQP